MVVQHPERNQYDQHWISMKLWADHGVPVIRRTLAEVQSHGRLGEDRSLHMCVQSQRYATCHHCTPPKGDPAAGMLMRHSSCSLSCAHHTRLLPVCLCSGEAVVSVVYYRAGYGPADYPSDLVSREAGPDDEVYSQALSDGVEQPFSFLLSSHHNFYRHTRRSILCCSRLQAAGCRLRG